MDFSFYFILATNNDTKQWSPHESVQHRRRQNFCPLQHECKCIHDLHLYVLYVCIYNTYMLGYIQWFVLLGVYLSHTE